MDKIHLWRGEFISDTELFSRLENFSDELAGLLGQKIELPALMTAAERLGQKILAKDPVYDHLFNELKTSGAAATSEEIESTLMGMADFLLQKNLVEKLKRELGSKTPFSNQRTTFQSNIFESWSPLGFLVHVTPTNSFSVAALSVVEGLLSGNVNFLKTSGSDSLFAQLFLKALVDVDDSGTIQNFIFAARISSKQTKLMQQLFSFADGVAAWGGEESVEAVKALCSAGTKIVDWGPKISFAYVSKSRLQDDEVMQQIAYDICLADQQACSSPQVLYVETSDPSEVNDYAAAFSDVLAKVSSAMPGLQPSMQEMAEITNVTQLAELGSCLDENKVWQAEDFSWRVIAEYKPGLKASPLYRTIFIKPLPRERIIATLKPLRSYLQTVGLAGSHKEIAELSEGLVQAGLQRVTRVGHMHDSYMGEPHDGRYALQHYCRRVSMQLDDQLQGISNLEDLRKTETPKFIENKPVMHKAEFQSQKIDDEFAKLYFKSGGSSGDPKLSVFTMDDYHGQMYAAAEGLYAAGLDPTQDRCLNTFFGGGLYGGFISFFTILEHLEAVQLPMASCLDFKFVVEMMIKNKVNVILGMPSYIIQLFHEQGEQLKEYGGVKKIFFGGEHFNEKQKEHLKTDFGVELIQSATYGSVDAGPLGYQCQCCEGSTHHVHSRLQHLEIFHLEKDEPIVGEDVGRLIFSSKMRQGQELIRYEIGDLGRWVSGDCGCGRKSARFELLGRHGDICRVGTTFVNYSKINRLLADEYDYAGELQLILESGQKERVVVCVSKIDQVDVGDIKNFILKAYKDLNEVYLEGLLEFDISFVDEANFEKISGSGKLRHIVDKRQGV